MAFRAEWKRCKPSAAAAAVCFRDFRGGLGGTGDVDDSASGVRVRLNSGVNASMAELNVNSVRLPPARYCNPAMRYIGHTGQLGIVYTY